MSLEFGAKLRVAVEEAARLNALTLSSMASGLSESASIYYHKEMNQENGVQTTECYVPPGGSADVVDTQLLDPFLSGDSVLEVRTSNEDMVD